MMPLPWRQRWKHRGFLFLCVLSLLTLSIGVLHLLNVLTNPPGDLWVALLGQHVCVVGFVLFLSLCWPGRHTLLYGVTLLGFVLLVDAGGWWSTVPFLDIPAHLLLGIGGGLLGFLLLPGGARSPRTLLLWPQGGTLVVGLGNEAVELLMDLILRRSYLLLSLQDTLGDLFWNTIGALLLSMLLLRSRRQLRHALPLLSSGPTCLAPEVRAQHH